MALLEVKNLSTNFSRSPQDVTNAVKGVSFQLEHGKTLALVGESGSGKSVTALSILGLLPYPLASHPTGSIIFQGQELLNQNEDLLRSIRGSKIGMIFQEPMTALNPLHTIGKQIAEPLFIHKGLTRSQARSRVIELLNLVGFPDGVERLNAFPHQLSGGQRQRVMIAMALACEPDLLIADEPTTALDVTIQASILDLIQGLQSRFKMALLLISHNLSIVSKMAENIAVMNHGQIVEQGETQKVLKNPTHPYTRHLIDSEPSGHPAPLKEKAPVILTAKDMCVKFEKKKGWFAKEKPLPLIAVNNISLSLRVGETLGIVGESGSGKTTLAYALLKLQQSTGEIMFEGVNLQPLSRKEMRPLRSSMQIVFQDPFSSLNPRLSISQIIEEGLVIHFPDLSKTEKEDKIIFILKEVDLDPEIRNRYPHELSGGQRQRIAIARSIILQSKLLILDEPTSALDRSIQAEVITLLRGLQSKHQLSYLFISHDLKVVRAMSHRIMVMKDGVVVEEGQTDEVFNNPKEKYTQDLLKAAFEY